MVSSYHPLYLKFVETFKDQKYFEAHEVLEDLWREERGESRNFYQGLIQVAAIFVHLNKGNDYGARELFKKASKNLQPYPECYLGIMISEMLEDVYDCIEQKAKHYKLKVKN